jgi:iron complex transport system ATP-binding protein
MTLALDDVTVKLGGATVVDALSMTFARGKVTAILGPNGAGKTSLIRALSGLVFPAKGRVLLDDLPLPSLEERARRIGYLPQNGQPSWNVSARELVGLGRLPHRSRLSASTPLDDGAIESAMIATDTLHLADRTIDTLSGGERARVKMARVLAGEPDWILADEPLANLDPPHVRDLLILFRGAAASGKGVIVVLHQLNAAARMADDILLMKGGRAIAQGAAKDALTPQTLEAAFEMAFDVQLAGSSRAILPRG